MVSVEESAPAHVVTLQLGQPVLGALQVRFAPGRAPDEHGLEQLASFAVRAAHALRSSERARDAGFELERSRALLSVVGEAISQLSLSHTLETAIERVAHLLGSDRVAVYLTDGDELTVAASRGIEGPHQAVADALLDGGAAVARRRRRSSSSTRRADERLAPVRAHVAEAGIGSVLALGLVVGDEPIGVLAVYPRQPAHAERERAVAADGARRPAGRRRRRTRGCTSDVTTLDDDLNELLASEREKSKQLHAHHEISRTFAQSLSLRDDARRAGAVDRRPARRRRGRDPDARRTRDRARSRARCTSTTSGSTCRADAALAPAAAAAPRPVRPASARRAAAPRPRPGRVARRRAGVAGAVPAQGLERCADPRSRRRASCWRR